MNVKRIGGLLLTASAVMSGLLALSPTAPAQALAAGTAATEKVLLTPSSGNSGTTIAVSFPSAQVCPGDANAGYLWQTFIAPRATDPATFTYSVGLPKGSDGSDIGAKALRSTSNAWIRNNNPGISDGQVAPPNNVVFSNATYSSLSGEYWFGLACTQDDAGFVTQTVRYWTTPVTITPLASAGPNNWKYDVGMTPAAPTLGALTPGDGEVEVNFTAAAKIAGNPDDTGYKVIVKDATCTTAVTTASGAASPITVSSGLTNGTTYCFSVVATNSFGDSAPSTTSTAAPVLPLSATPGNKSAVLSWSAGAWPSLAPVTDYVIEYRRVGTGAWKSAKKVVSTLTTFTVLGLTNGLDYEFRVAGKKSTAVGDYLTVGPVVPRTVPGKPRNLKATPRNGSISLSWLAPSSNGGNPLTDYVIELWNGSAWSTVIDGVNTDLSYTITGLLNGTGYKVRVSAQNEAGTGLALATAKPVKPYLSLPTAPKTVKAVASSSALIVTWKAPANDGGSDLTDYLVEWSTNGLTWSSANAGTALTYTITGLVPGTAYRVRVSATNTVQAGYGPAGSIAKPVKPLA